MDDVVWVFHGNGAKFAAAVFRTADDADRWIARHALSGLLTEYPVGTSHLDWMIARHGFSPRPDQLANPAWIGGFSSGVARHLHYVDGVRDGAD